MRGLRAKAPVWRSPWSPHRAPSAASYVARQPRNVLSADKGECIDSAIRHFAAVPQRESSESSASLLHMIQGTNDAEEGNVLSVSGGLVRMELPGPVTIGQVVRLGDDGALGVVLRYDRRGAIAAVLNKQMPRSGSSVVPLGTLSLPVSNTFVGTSSQTSFMSVDELLSSAAPSEVAADHVLRLPAIPPPHRRRKVKRYLPSGLAVTESVLPFGEGQRIGLVGPPGTGKSRAVQMILESQMPDTVCVFATQTLTPHMKALLAAQSAKPGAAPLTVLHANAADSPGTRYLLPFCAIRLASQLREKHRHVLLVLDDVIGFAAAADELGVAPLGAPHTIAAALSSACNAEIAGRESSLSMAVVFDVAPDDDVMTPTLRDLWRGTADLLDVQLEFSPTLASIGIFPAIDSEQLLPTCGLVPPGHQAPFFKQLRRELLVKLRSGRDLEKGVEIRKQLGFHIELDEQEDLASFVAARAILGSQAVRRPASETAVLLCATVVMQFLGASRRPTRRAVETFQQAAITTIREMHPAVWNTLCMLEELDDAQASGAIMNLAEALLQHRFDFELTRPEL